MAAMRSSPLNQFSECSFPHLSSFTGQGRTTFLFSCSWIERSARGEEKFQINFHVKRGCKSAAQRAKGIGKKVATSLQGYSNECVGCEEWREGGGAAIWIKRLFKRCCVCVFSIINSKERHFLQNTPNTLQTHNVSFCCCFFSPLQVPSLHVCVCLCVGCHRNLQLPLKWTEMIQFAWQPVLASVSPC